MPKKQKKKFGALTAGDAAVLLSVGGGSDAPIPKSDPRIDGTETFSINSEEAKRVVKMLQEGHIKMSEGAQAVRNRFAAFHKFKKQSWANTYNRLRKDISSVKAADDDDDDDDDDDEMVEVTPATSKRPRVSEGDIMADAGYEELIVNEEVVARMPFVLATFSEPKTKRKHVMAGIWMQSGKYVRKATIVNGSEFKISVEWNKMKFNAEQLLGFLSEPKDKKEKAIYYRRISAMEEAFNSLLAHSDSKVKSVMRIKLPAGLTVGKTFDINKGIVDQDGGRFLFLEASEPMNDFEQQDQDDDYEVQG